MNGISSTDSTPFQSLIVNALNRQVDLLLIDLINWSLASEPVETLTVWR